MRRIKLTQGKFALVDNEDFVLLNQFHWKFDKSTGYACRTLYPKGKEYMHRVIHPTIKPLQVDHINRNKLDNRRTNLRGVSPKVNLNNTSLRVTNKSGYKGVWFWKERQKWSSYIWLNYKKIHLGLFTNLNEAINARQIAERKYL